MALANVGGHGEQLLANPHVLCRTRGILTHCLHTTIHVKLTNHSSLALELRNDRLLEGWTDAEAQEAQQDAARLVCGTNLSRQKVLGAAARGKRDNLVLNIFGVKGLIPQLAAPDTLAVDTLLFGSILHQLRQIGLDALARVAKTVLAGLLKVALDAVDADPLRCDALAVNQNILEFGGVRCALRIRLPLARGLPLLDLGEIHVQARIVLHIVWDEVRVRLEHLLVALLVALWSRTREVGHDVNLHLEPVVLQELDGLLAMAGEVTPVDLAQDVIVRVLNANLHARDAIATEANNLWGSNLVRARLHTEADHVDARRHIKSLLLLDGTSRPVLVLVEGVGAIVQVADEGVGDPVVVAAKGATEDAELDLINLVTVDLESLQTDIDLLDRVEADLLGALEDVLIAQIRARHPWLIRAKVAVVLAAELVRWQGDAHIQNTARAADGLLNKRIAQRRNSGKGLGLGLDELLIQEAELSLGRNHLVLAAQFRKYNLKGPRRRKDRRRAEHKVCEDALDTLDILGERVSLNGNILNVHCGVLLVSVRASLDGWAGFNFYGKKHKSKGNDILY